MRERLEAAAGEWLRSGRDAHFLLTGKAYFAAQCWLNSSGGLSTGKAGVTQNIQEFVHASKAGIGGQAGWIAMLNEKTLCAGCGMSYHLENIAICTGCMEYVCGACRSSHSKCDGEVVG